MKGHNNSCKAGNKIAIKLELAKQTILEPLSSQLRPLEIFSKLFLQTFKELFDELQPAQSSPALSENLDTILNISFKE